MKTVGSMGSEVPHQQEQPIASFVHLSSAFAPSQSNAIKLSRVGDISCG